MFLIFYLHSVLPMFLLQLSQSSGDELPSLTSLLSTPISTCRHLPKAIRNEFGRTYAGLLSSFVAHPIMSNAKLLMAFAKCTLFPLRRGGRAHRVDVTKELELRLMSRG